MHDNVRAVGGMHGYDPGEVWRDNGDGGTGRGRGRLAKRARESAQRKAGSKRGREAEVIEECGSGEGAE